MLLVFAIIMVINTVAIIVKFFDKKWDVIESGLGQKNESSHIADAFRPRRNAIKIMFVLGMIPLLVVFLFGTDSLNKISFEVQEIIKLVAFCVIVALSSMIITNDSYWIKEMYMRATDSINNMRGGKRNDSLFADE